MDHVWGMPCSLGNARFVLAPFIGPAMSSPGLSPWTVCLSLPTCLGGDIRALWISQKQICGVRDPAVSESQAAREDGIRGTWGSSVLQKVGPVICAMEMWNMNYKEWHGLASFLNWFLGLWYHQPPSLVVVATPWRNPGSEKPDMIFDGDIPALGGSR